MGGRFNSCGSAIVGCMMCHEYFGNCGGDCGGGGGGSGIGGGGGKWKNHFNLY